MARVLLFGGILWARDQIDKVLGERWPDMQAGWRIATADYAPVENAGRWLSERFPDHSWLAEDVERSPAVLREYSGRVNG